MYLAQQKDDWEEWIKPTEIVNNIITLESVRFS